MSKLAKIVKQNLSTTGKIVTNCKNCKQKCKKMVKLSKLSKISKIVKMLITFPNHSDKISQRSQDSISKVLSDSVSEWFLLLLLFLLLKILTCFAPCNISRLLYWMKSLRRNCRSRRLKQSCLNFRFGLDTIFHCGIC